MNRRRRKTLLGAAMAVVAVGVVGATVTAFADEQAPTSAELLAQCGSADSCVYHPASYWLSVGSEHQVGDAAYNCTSTSQQLQINWSETTGTTDSVAVSASVAASVYNIAGASV